MKYIHYALYEGGLKSSYDDVISAIDNFFNQRDLSPTTPVEVECEPQEGLC